jgi:hypothetical protein
MAACRASTASIGMATSLEQQAHEDAMVVSSEQRPDRVAAATPGTSSRGGAAWGMTTGLHMGNDGGDPWPGRGRERCGGQRRGFTRIESGTAWGRDGRAPFGERRRDPWRGRSRETWQPQRDGVHGRRQRGGTIGTRNCSRPQEEEDKASVVPHLHRKKKIRQARSSARGPLAPAQPGESVLRVTQSIFLYYR